MRMMQKNKLRMKYALLQDVVPVYQTDSEGNIVYDDVDGEMVPRDTGKTRPVYGPAINFSANVNFSGQSEVGYAAYGLSKSQFDAIFYAMKGELPVDETSILFVDADPEYELAGHVKPESADYRVVRIVPSLNYTTYLIRNAERTETNGG